MYRAWPRERNHCMLRLINDKIVDVFKHAEGKRFSPILFFMEYRDRLSHPNPIWALAHLLLQGFQLYWN